MFKRKFATFLFLAVVVCILGAAQAHADPGALDDELTYGYFNHKGSQDYMVVAQVATCTTSLPKGKNVFTYTPVEAPVVDCDPAKAKPIGVGGIAVGENSLEVAVNVGPFDEPVDVSFGYFSASFDAGDIYFLNIFQQITSLQDDIKNGASADDPTLEAAGKGQGFKSYHENRSKKYKKLITWKSGVYGVNETLLGPTESLQDIPPGLYVLVLNVTRSSPADNNFDRFYRWVTYFIVPDRPE